MSTAGPGFRWFPPFSNHEDRQQPSNKQSDRAQRLRASRVQKALMAQEWDPLTLHQRLNEGTSALFDRLERFRHKRSAHQLCCLRSDRLALSLSMIICRPNGSDALPGTDDGSENAGLRFGDFDVDFPLAVRLQHGLQARPDVQLQLIRIRAGADVQTRSDSADQSRPKPQPLTSAPATCPPIPMTFAM